VCVCMHARTCVRECLCMYACMRVHLHVGGPAACATLAWVGLDWIGDYDETWFSMNCYFALLWLHLSGVHGNLARKKME